VFAVLEATGLITKMVDDWMFCHTALRCSPEGGVFMLAQYFRLFSGFSGCCVRE